MKPIKRHSDINRTCKIRLCHISDTHGSWPALSGAHDVVVHSGDFLPDSNKYYLVANKTLEMAYQLDWLNKNLNSMSHWLKGRTFLFTCGNHDFLHGEMIESVLGSAGIKAICLNDKIVTYEGVNFYGFPYVPAINGLFNYEKQLDGMQIEVDKLVEVLNQTYVDVLVAHAPPYQILDLTRSNEVIGNQPMADAFKLKIKPEMRPMHYLCGHVHESNGLRLSDGTLFSNAATTKHIIEIF